MSVDIKEAVRALFIKMVDETDPKKLELLKQRLRLLFLDYGAELEKEERERNGPGKIWNCIYEVDVHSSLAVWLAPILNPRWSASQRFCMGGEKISKVLESVIKLGARILKPLFDLVWNAGRLPASLNFDSEGNWVNRR
jgi:hypothetical protein